MNRIHETKHGSKRFCEIPEELESAPWVLWRGVPKKNGKLDKQPFQPCGQLASVSDSKTWSSFETVLESVPRFDGIGFVNTPDSPWTVLDVDSAIENGKLKSSALALIERFETYTEISPSGRGLRIILRGRVKSSGTDKVEFPDGAIVEVFHGSHYFTMTGEIVQGRGEIEDCTEQLKTFLLQNGKGEATEQKEAASVAQTRIPMTRAIDIACRYYDFNDYSQWVEIGQILKASYGDDDRSFSAWCEWSEQSVKYPGDGVSRKKWSSFRRDEKTVGSLYHKECEMLRANVLRVLPGGLRVLCGGNLDERTHGNAPESPIDAGEWLAEPLEPIEPVLTDFLTVGDKLLICGKSKTRKSFLALQLAVCLASGRDFLSWAVPRKRRVLVVQLEIQPSWFHRRLKRVCDALKVGPEDLRGSLAVVNGRGKAVTMATIEAQAKRVNAEIILIDPIYKLTDFDENDTQGWKMLLRELDELGAKLRATVCFIHHDRKGLVSEDAVDRGSGSGVLGRDWDCFIGLAPHATTDGVTVIDGMTRNFPPTDSAISLEFIGGAFRVSSVAPLVASSGSGNPTSDLDLDVFREQAIQALADGPVAPKVLKDTLKQRLMLTDRRVLALFDLLKEDPRVARLKGRRKLGESDRYGLREDVERMEQERASEE